MAAPIVPRANSGPYRTRGTVSKSELEKVTKGGPEVVCTWGTKDKHRLVGRWVTRYDDDSKRHYFYVVETAETDAMGEDRWLKVCTQDDHRGGKEELYYVWSLFYNMVRKHFGETA